jgi:hypothetical protein
MGEENQSWEQQYLKGAEVKVKRGSVGGLWPNLAPSYVNLQIFNLFHCIPRAPAPESPASFLDCGNRCEGWQPHLVAGSFKRVGAGIIFPQQSSFQLFRMSGGSFFLHLTINIVSKMWKIFDCPPQKSHRHQSQCIL